MFMTNDFEFEYKFNGIVIYNLYCHFIEVCLIKLNGKSFFDSNFTYKFTLNNTRLNNINFNYEGLFFNNDIL
jgi:hypothetical protein